MAVTKRQVATLVIATAVLATAGAGVYSFSTGGWLSGWLSHPRAELVADHPTTFGPATPQSNLDAVASAWADTPTGNSTPPVVQADYVSAASPPVNKYDRYATPVATVAGSPIAEPDDAVARGQDDEDDSASEDDTDATDELNPLREAATSRKPIASSRRAREAFSNSTSSKSDDRYGNLSSDSSPFRSDAAQDQPQVNPFASQPTSSASTLPPITPLEAAKTRPENGDSLDQAAENNAALPPLQEDGPASSIPYVGSASEYSKNARPMSLGGLPETDGSLSAGGSEAYGTTLEGTGRPGERSLEGPQKPSLEIQKFAPAEIQVGKPAKFLVQIHNVGGRPADEVVIRDEVPHGTRLVSTSPRAEVDGSHLTWELGTFSAGEQRAVEIQLMPTTEGELGSVATVSFATPASVKTRCTMPQLAIRMTAPSQVMIGGEQRVKIELRNPGTGDATGVMLFENVPEQVRHDAGPALEFEIGTLHPGEMRELELSLTAEKPGHVVNILSARADGNLQVQQQVEFEIIAPALEVEVEGPTRRYLERPATYQVNISNPGTAPAQDVEIVTKLPKGMRFVRANNMGEYDASTHAIYWSLAELPEGERGAVELVAMPIESGEQTLEVEGHAQQGLSDQTKHQVLVEGLAAIMFEVTDLEDPIEVGGETTYEIRVVNQGSKAATNVQVAVNVPPGLQVVSASGETRHTIQSGGITFEPLAQLAPKADSLFRVQVQGVQPGDQRVTVQLNTDDITQPIRKEESTRVFGDE